MAKLWDGFEERVQRKVQGALQAAGELVATEAKRSVQKSPRGGAVYEKYTPRRTHKASAPDEAPATDLGGLVRSITVVPAPERLAVVVKCAKALAPYAMALEYGTMDGRIKRRPFLRPALKKKRAAAVALIRRAVKEAIQGV